MKKSLLLKISIAVFSVFFTLFSFFASGCASPLEKARKSFNPHNYGYVAIGKYGQLLSNRYEEVDVRQYGIPLSHEFIHFDGTYLYFAAGKLDNKSETIDDYLHIYIYDPVNKTSEVLFTFMFMELKTVFPEAMHLKTVRVTSPGEFTFIATGHDYSPNPLMAYEISVIKEGLVMGKRSYKISSMENVINSAETRNSKYKWVNNPPAPFETLALTDGTTEKLMFAEDNTDAVWKHLKTQSGVDSGNVTRMGPYKNGYSVVEIYKKSGGLVTGSKEYYYFVCSYEKGGAEFFAYTGKDPLQNVFIIE